MFAVKKKEKLCFYMPSGELFLLWSTLSSKCVTEWRSGGSNNFIPSSLSRLFQALDYETKSSYIFTVKVKENMHFSADNAKWAITSAEVLIWHVVFNPSPNNDTALFFFLN